MRDHLKLASHWTKTLAQNGEQVQLVYEVQNASKIDGLLEFRHAVPRGTTIKGMDGPGGARQLSDRGFIWVTPLAAGGTVALAITLRLDVYRDDNGKTIPRLEVPKRLVDTVQLGALKFISDDGTTAFNDMGDCKATQLLVQ